MADAELAGDPPGGLLRVLLALMARRTQLSEASLDAQAAISPHFPLSVLDGLIRARANA